MGNAVEYPNIRKGNASEYVGIGKARIVNGVKGRIVKRRGDPDTFSNLSIYANTSEVYFRQSEHGVSQARVYVNHRMSLDFDWGHNHRNKSDKRLFKVGTVHVQGWRWKPDGTFERLSDSARLMNNVEMKKYGPIIRAFCPTVKFR